jgi:hypothetical protein
LAAAAVPYFAAKESNIKYTALRFNLKTLRMQIETYKNQHGGAAPRLSMFAEQMTKPTGPSGHVNGLNLTCGPYFQGQIPANPFNGNNLLVSVPKAGQPPTRYVPGFAGWQYDETTGDIYPNNPEYYPTRR